MHSRVVPRATGQNSLNVVRMNGLRAPQPEISSKERPTNSRYCGFKKLDATVGTRAVNEGGSCLDEKPEPTLGIEMIVKRVDGILTFLTHEPECKQTVSITGCERVVGEYCMYPSDLFFY
jgi:hypothetical protein